jgi:hypothetical protein
MPQVSYTLLKSFGNFERLDETLKKTFSTDHTLPQVPSKYNSFGKVPKEELK